MVGSVLEKRIGLGGQETIEVKNRKISFVVKRIGTKKTIAMQFWGSPVLTIAFMMIDNRPNMIF